MRTRTRLSAATLGCLLLATLGSACKSARRPPPAPPVEGASLQRLELLDEHGRVVGTVELPEDGSPGAPIPLEPGAKSLRLGGGD